MSLREVLADISHDIWSHWMRYMFTKCLPTSNDSELVIPSSLVERWRRQMDTPYKDLTFKEQESDREQADKILKVVGTNQNLAFDSYTTLEWYDGPIIVRAVSEGKTYLGLLLPDDRWMYALLNREQIALLDKQQLSLRETFRNPTGGYVFVAIMLEVAGRDLPEDYLPTEDAGTI